MALDCNILRFLAYELNKTLNGGRIDKIYQMSKTQILMTIRSLGGNYRLYASCDAQKGRVCLTNQKFENPDVPPVFCMLMRKHLSGGKITDISTVKNERILKIEVESTNELFEITKRTLIVEIMGKHSNIILTDEDGRIIDCASRVDFTVSEKRQVLPGLYYELPPKSGKADPFETDNVKMLDILSQKDANTDLSDIILSGFDGMSPLLSREIAHKANNDAIKGVVVLKEFLSKIENYEKKPLILIDKKTNEPKDLYIFDIEQYGDFYEKKYFDTVNECVDFFYTGKEEKRKLDEKKQSLYTVISKSISKTSKKLDIHTKNVEKAKKKDRYRIYAELITANLYKLTKNSNEAILENYYDNNNPITVPMDETMSPARNAKKYFEKYNKEKTMEKISSEMIKELEEELKYLFELRDTVEICNDKKSLDEIKEELIFGEYIKEKTKSNVKKKQPVSKPLEFMSTDGFLILCGRNNRQNEELTLKIASKNDLWLHIRNVAGSHVVIRSQGSEIPDKTLEEAAIIAAVYSKKSKDTKADVDYTQVRYVKKPANAKPGMVIYDNFKGITVEPDIKIAESLKR